jgi:hypothetical protein
MLPGCCAAAQASVASMNKAITKIFFIRNLQQSFALLREVVTGAKLG